MTKMNQRDLVNDLDTYICSVVLNTNEQKDAYVYALYDNQFYNKKLIREYNSISPEVYLGTVISSADGNSRELINDLDKNQCAIDMIVMHIQDISLNYEPLMDFLWKYDISYIDVEAEEDD